MASQPYFLDLEMTLHAEKQPHYPPNKHYLQCANTTAKNIDSSAVFTKYATKTTSMCRLPNYETLSHIQINMGAEPTHPVGQGGLERVLVGHQELGGHSVAYSNSNSPHTLTVDRPVGALKSHQKVNCTKNPHLPASSSHRHLSNKYQDSN